MTRNRYGKTCSRSGEYWDSPTTNIEPPILDYSNLVIDSDEEVPNTW
jgi:hypothetical protein